MFQLWYRLVDKNSVRGWNSLSTVETQRWHHFRTNLRTFFLRFTMRAQKKSQKINTGLDKNKKKIYLFLVVKRKKAYTHMHICQQFQLPYITLKLWETLLRGEWRISKLASATGIFCVLIFIPTPSQQKKRHFHNFLQNWRNVFMSLQELFRRVPKLGHTFRPCCSYHFTHFSEENAKTS